MTFGPIVFKSVGLADLRLATTLVYFGRFHDMYLAGKFGDRFSRRALLLWGTTCMILTSVGFTLCQMYPNDTTNWIQIGCMILFVAAFCASIGSLGWLVPTELVPESLGATSGAIATFTTWTAQFFIGVYFQQISSPEHWGTQAFGMFPAVLVVFAAFVWSSVLDSRNKTSEEVTAMFAWSQGSSAKANGAFVYWTSDKENCILSSP
ncbi:hypothetical protein H310_12247 [Aphanomyces invadans]|uniref:Major facilitator superfamily (MFS) profile domain-containing protein n=1 Tax=Aphanomyces invadans TaxID=157072 RepID=A0A024TIQ2_9STRA|nr:hypothetical protein H310_12247 [Aphanomyces invadans]ETV93903.1 hypothetical protein H310_12247 [Aphanomyces invadans]|eukprot:XP_008877463.1 hypothetical protein H310_12247 [Aphanomyces invadans]